MRRKPQPEARRRRYGGGLSVVEVLGVLALLCIVLTCGSVSYLRWISGVSVTHLNYQVRQLNSALALYEANGGHVYPSDSIHTVILKLKAPAKEDECAQLAGLRGKMIDARLKPVLQSPEEAEGNQWRAWWDGSRKRFALAETGVGGIKKFKLEESAIPSDCEVAAMEARNIRLKLATNSTWIWDYDESGTVSGHSPEDLFQSRLASYDAVAAGIAAGELPRKLDPPAFSILSGTFDHEVFPLELMLFNLNPEGSSVIVYATNGLEWQDYAPGSVIFIQGDDAVCAMARSLDTSRYFDSNLRTEIYAATPLLPDPPIVASASVLILDEEVISNGLSAIEEAAQRHGVSSDQLVNDDNPTECGNPWLMWSEQFAGDEVVLSGGQDGDEGWFGLAADTPWSLEDFVEGNVAQNRLDKIRAVNPLDVYSEFEALVGGTFVGIVYDSDISMNYDPNEANLQGARLGRLSFSVLEVTTPVDGSSDSLWSVRVRIEGTDFSRFDYYDET